MKKFIISAFAFILGLVFSASVANAQAVFNNPGVIPTLTITNASTNPCSGPVGNGCWSTSTQASPGDVIAVQVYYYNTSNTTATETTLSIQPKNSSGSVSTMTFSGGVASLSGPRSVGNVSVSVSTPVTITYLPGSARWYPSNGSGSSVNENGLFGSSGFNVGNVVPGQGGTLVANFQIGQSQTVNPPIYYPPQNYYYQCNDGIDNDGDGYRDYPADSGCYSSTDNDESNYVAPIVNQNIPQAVTTVATILSTTQARLNGVAVPNTTYGSATAWFEWGTTGYLGNKTNTQTVNGSSSSNVYFSDVVGSLVPGTWYYYRAVVQNQYGIAYGDIVRFNTQPSTTTTTTVKTNTVVVNTSKSQASLLELKIENNFEKACTNEFVDYTVTYTNISKQTLKDTVLRFTNPKEISFISSSRGEYEVVDRTLTVDLGDISANEKGVLIVHARINSNAVEGNLTVATASVVYTNTVTKAQEDAIAYSLINIDNDCPNIAGFGASTSGFWSFLPNTLLEWLLLILVILGLIVLGRNLYSKKTV